MEHQGPRRYAACKIVVQGKDVTARMNPYLISVQIIDTFGASGHDQCNIELDDRNAELSIPPDGVPLQAYLGWAGGGPRPFALGGTEVPLPTEGKELDFGGPGMQLLFSGIVSSAESGFTRRGGGRRLWIEATSSNTKGPGKEVQTGSWGEGKPDDSASASGGGGGGGAGAAAGGKIPLQKVLTEMAQKSGLSVKLSPEMMKISRDYWHVNESFQNFGQRMAHELGGMFKISNGVAMLVGKDEGVNADGETLSTVDAVWGVNLIGWRIKPFVGRPQYQKAAETAFKLFDAEWEHIEKAIGGGTPFGSSNAVAQGVGKVVDKAVGEQQAGGTGADSKQKRGTGWALLNGDPRCKAGNSLHIKGARPGVDGVYLMIEVEHNYTRGVGYQTRANLTNPRPDYGGYESWPEPAFPELPPPSWPEPVTSEDILKEEPPPGTQNTIAERFGQYRFGTVEPEPPPKESYEPGQAGEGGVTYPE